MQEFQDWSQIACRVAKKLKILTECPDYYAALDRAARKLISICDDVLLSFAESDRG